MRQWASSLRQYCCLHRTFPVFIVWCASSIYGHRSKRDLCASPRFFVEERGTYPTSRDTHRAFADHGFSCMYLRTFFRIFLSYRSVLEEAVAALDIDTDSPQHLNVGPSSVSPSTWRNPLVRTRSPSAHYSARRLPAKQAGIPGTSPPSGSRSDGRLAATPVAQSLRQHQDVVPRPYGATTRAAVDAVGAGAGSDPSGGICSRSRGAFSTQARQSASRYASIPHDKGASFAVEKGPVSWTAVKGLDLSGVGDPEPCPSPVERVLARRKRRRRSNLSVSSALLLSASYEDVPLPSVVSQRPSTPLENLEDNEDDTVPGLYQKLAGLDMR